MPTPVPDPADRSSVHRATDRTHIRPPDPDSPTDSAHPVQDPNSEPPTVISSQKITPRFDPNIADGLAGRKLGPFELIEGVGAGGMAAVLRARDSDLGRVVALKILPPDMAADPENVVRFKQEARSAALLDHENVARVYHCSEDQGLHFIAFEFVEGDNLRQVMESHGGTIPVPDAISIMLQVAAGLAHAAERGVVHRDIKPSNIIVTPDGRAKIVDMGLARSLDARHNGQLTQSGVTLGTFDYISPEQAIDPRSADVRSDIYSLGCTFYHVLTGHVPVPEGTAAAKLDAQKNLLPPDPRTFNPAIPADLVVILGRMMAKEPDRRYQHPDHLAAHLRGLARKLGLPATLVPLTGPAEDPVPPPPRLSVAWGLTAIAVMALCVVIFTNAFRAPPPMPTWADGPGIEIATEPDDPGTGTIARAPLTEPRPAATVGELVALLRAGVPHIRLTGTRYDLWAYWKDLGQPADLVLKGDDVSLEADAPAEITIGFARDVPARPKTLTLRGTGKGSAVVKGITFNLVGPADEADAGLVISGFSNVRVEECKFTLTTRSGPVALLIPTKGTATELKQCYFGRGGTGVLVHGPAELKAEQCAFAPHQAVVRVTRADDEAGETTVSLTHCTARLEGGGALIDVADEVPCVVRAGDCLFAGPVRYGPLAESAAPVVFRQKDLRTAHSTYGPATLLGIGSGNAYHNVLAYGDGAKEYTFEECAASGFPVKDVERSIPVNPFESSDPVFVPRNDPSKVDLRAAFLPNRQLPDLRVPGDPAGVMFGTRFVGREQLYALPLSAPGKPDRDATVKVWDPNATEETPGVYRLLRKAIADVQTGDTLLIRHTGELPIEPTEIKEDMQLTIKPDGNFKPVLVPKAPLGSLKRKAMFAVYGRLVLDGLQFRIPADRMPAIAVMPGGGQFELRNAVVTFDDAEDLSAVVLDDPKNQMMMGADPRPPVPKVVVDRTVLRGKGRLLAVAVSRPFELDVKSTLAALDETLIAIEPAASTDPAPAGTGTINLTRVTTYLSESLISIRGADRRPDAMSAGLMKTDVTATQCLFVQSRGEARESFVRTDRLDTEDQVRRYFGWRGQGNVYGYEKRKVMLDLHPVEAPVMPAKSIDGDEWLRFDREEAGDPFVKVGFRIQPPDAGSAGSAKSFALVRPRDFEGPVFTPARQDNSQECGAAVRDLPDPFAE